MVDMADAEAAGAQWQHLSLLDTTARSVAAAEGASTAGDSHGCKSKRQGAMRMRGCARQEGAVTRCTCLGGAAKELGKDALLDVVHLPDGGRHRLDQPIVDVWLVTQRAHLRLLCFYFLPAFISRLLAAPSPRPSDAAHQTSC